MIIDTNNPISNDVTVIDSNGDMIDLVLSIDTDDKSATVAMRDADGQFQLNDDKNAVDTKKEDASEWSLCYKGNQFWSGAGGVSDQSIWSLIGNN